ncbi:putative 2-oxoglutarate/Fe(II)-dependent dioxygenase [Morus notabilis]|uniref:Putative 2-oxoglutarate/Fe(II)-dependent dioxygenase n=1 Tax=Morus notabilis TaxID=981085 RepID=W9SDW7_9ROSA|nr:protein DMR6-LIKE OXYGENASE 2 [Morus notabilis]EXC41811.1 putative 2-oxoglutarate/Fe(II)-dependent dioxygenase [Morus notabilis]
MTSIKSLLAESPYLTSIPASYIFRNNNIDPNDSALLTEPELKIPIIDFSLLTSGDPNQRSKVISELGEACENWGFFMVINHSVPERLIDAVIDGCKGFFDLAEEEKLEFKGKHVLDPIRYGTSFNASVDKVFYWRDFLKVFVHPQFHFPNKPSGFSELALEFCKKIRQVVKGILGGISEGLGLERDYIYKSLNLESGLQVFAANLYPPCPQPELAMGMPPHSDHGVLTLLIQNGICGLQIQHNGKWVNVNAIPNSFLVNTCDQLEIFSNGKYKSVVHRAVVNNNATRISLAIANGPSLDTVVSPASELVENRPPAYIGLKYKEYLELQQSRNLNGKCMLDCVRLL